MTQNPKILVFSASLRTGSWNTRLADLATREITDAGGVVTRLSLADYPLPIYDGNLEADEGIPVAAQSLKNLFSTHQGIFITSPEYNAAISPLLKNVLDWISRVQDDNNPFTDRVFALASASPGSLGGLRGLMALRQMLELGLGALVLPEQVIVGQAMKAFNAKGILHEERTSGILRTQTRKLVSIASRYVT